MHVIAKALIDIEDQLKQHFLERTDALRVMLLATLAGEHAFILGPPGTAKSQVIRAFVAQIDKARYFEVGLSKTRPAEPVLGPLDIQEFRQNGNYFLKRKGYATAVEFLFLDEIGKMSAVLGHDLLALLNERVYHEVNGGLSVHPAPLSSAFCASNEMLTDESDDMAALWDRLLFRVAVDYLKDDSNFATLLRAGKPQVDTTVDWDELHEVITQTIPAVTWNDEALAGMVRLRKTFVGEHIVISDRRWRASVKALQAAAFLAGREEIIEDDLAVLRFTLWDTVEQMERVERLCLSASNPFVDDLFQIRTMIREVDDRIAEQVSVTVETRRAEVGREMHQKLGNLRGRMDTMLMEAADRKIPGFKAVSDLHHRTLVRNYVVCMSQDQESAELAAQRHLGSGDGGNE